MTTTIDYPAPIVATGHDWPDPPAPTAFSGLAGEVVCTLAPHTEADPVALLLSLLVAFGNLIGPGPHFIADAARHSLNLFCALVGVTADARKGASWAQIRRLLETADPEWASGCIHAGLSTAAGLIHALRDPAVLRGSQLPTTDRGAQEKRLLVVESDFAPALCRLARRGDTLSSLLRAAWDTGDLQLLTRARATRATGAHLSIIGHLTPEELLHSLPSSEIAGGLANRFLWACVRRSRCLPDGEPVDLQELQPLAARIASSAASAREVGKLTRDAAARDLWHKTYPGLSQARPGAEGAVLGRAAPQVMRLACLYALLDEAPHVRQPHLEAALALWTYCHDSVGALFTSAYPTTLVDRLLHALRQTDRGLTRRDIAHSAGHNRMAAEVSAALDSLAAQGLAMYRMETKGRGRPTERWFAIPQGET